MNLSKRIIFVIMLVSVMAGCTTSGTFKVPEGSKLYINKRPQAVAIGANGRVTTKPYYWTSVGIPPKGGIPYRVEKDGKTLKEGKLRSVIRGVSFVWPPFAAIYWPVGLNPNITYDLVNDTQE